MVLTDLDFNTLPPLRPPSDRDRKPLPKRITNKQRQQAVELYKTGLSLNAVAREVGISRQTVRKAVVDGGVAIRPRNVNNAH